MVVLGLLLVLAAIVAGVLAVYGLPTASSTVSWEFLGNSVSISPTMIFFIGVASAIALALGLWLMSLGAKSSARKRRELKELRREQKDSDRRERELAAQRERELAAQRDREQARAARSESSMSAHRESADRDTTVGDGATRTAESTVRDTDRR